MVVVSKADKGLLTLYYFSNSFSSLSTSMIALIASH